MSIEELETAVVVIKWVYPVISGAFIMIVGLLIYIWKTNTKRTDDILEGVSNNLKELRILVAEHKIQIRSNKENIDKIERKVE